MRFLGGFHHHNSKTLQYLLTCPKGAHNARPSGATPREPPLGMACPCRHCPAFQRTKFGKRYNGRLSIPISSCGVTCVNHCAWLVGRCMGWEFCPRHLITAKHSAVVTEYRLENGRTPRAVPADRPQLVKSGHNWDGPQLVKDGGNWDGPQWRIAAATGTGGSWRRTTSTGTGGAHG